MQAKINFDILDKALSGQAQTMLVVGACLLLLALVIRDHTRFTTLFFGVMFGGLAVGAAFAFYASDALARTELSVRESLYISYKAQALIVSFVAVFGGLSANLLVLHMTKRGEPFFGCVFGRTNEKEIENMIDLIRKKIEDMPEAERELYLRGVRDAVTLCEHLQARKLKISDSRIEERLARGSDGANKPAGIPRPQ